VGEALGAVVGERGGRAVRLLFLFLFGGAAFFLARPGVGPRSPGPARATGPPRGSDRDGGSRAARRGHSPHTTLPAETNRFPVLPDRSRAWPGTRKAFPPLRRNARGPGTGPGGRGLGPARSAPALRSADRRCRGRAARTAPWDRRAGCANPVARWAGAYKRWPPTRIASGTERAGGTPASDRAPGARGMPKAGGAGMAHARSACAMPGPTARKGLRRVELGDNALGIEG